VVVIAILIGLLLSRRAERNPLHADAGSGRSLRLELERTPDSLYFADIRELLPPKYNTQSA
jgi:hypothetical protein